MGNRALAYYHGRARLGRVVMLRASHWPTTFSFDVNGWYVLISFTCNHCKVFSFFPASIVSAVMASFNALPICFSIFVKVSSVWWWNVENREDLFHISMSTTSGHKTPHAPMFMLCRIWPPGPFDLGWVSTARVTSQPSHLNWITKPKPFLSTSYSIRGFPSRRQIPVTYGQLHFREIYPVAYVNNSVPF